MLALNARHALHLDALHAVRALHRGGFLVPIVVRDHGVALLVKHRHTYKSSGHTQFLS